MNAQEELILLAEYKDLSDNMRHYGNMRFAQLTLYFGLSAGLITVLFTVEPPLYEGLRLVFMIIGAVVSAAFGVMEERSSDYWHHRLKRSIEIEKLLKCQQHTKVPYAGSFTATNAVRMMLWGGAFLWLAAAILCIVKFLVTSQGLWAS